MRTGLTEELLDEEIQLIRDDLGDLAGVTVWRVRTDVLVGFESGRGGSPGLFRLQCAGFDAQPPSLAMLDPGTHEELPLESWTPGVPHSLHPVTQKPFVCLQGLAEYHTHPSHIDDNWDRYRSRFRLPQTVRRLLQKAGVLP